MEAGKLVRESISGDDFPCAHFARRTMQRLAVWHDVSAFPVTARPASGRFLAWQKSEDVDKIERDLAARIDRKRIFERADPATLIAVIDEAVLYRRIGDEKTMREQL